MSKIGLIIKREYLRRVSKKSFILLTFLTPFLFAALVFVPLWLSSIKGDEVHTIAILDSTGKYAPLFEDTETYRFIHSDQSMDTYKQIPDKEIFAFLTITEDLLENPKAATLYSKKQIPGELSRLVNMTLKKQIESDKLATFNIPNLKEIIKESKINFNIQTIKWGDDGSEKQSSSVVASITGVIFTMLIYMFIMIYGAMVMQGVMEEKTNRIIEIMISSVKPFDLMMGKIIGIGFVGLTQVFLWAIMTLILITGGSFLVGGGIDNEMLQSGMALNANPNIAMMSTQQPSNEWIEMLGTINFAEIGILFVVYFIGGYLLYSSLFAAIGSAVDSQEDTQQFMLPVTLLLVFALYAGIYSMENPDGPLAFWCSMIPFTSPIVMMVRMPFEVPLWQIVLSVGLLYICSIGFTWLSAKIYRVGILMYGKKPSIKEMIKWLRYK
ncbi:ABC transporter permease [Parabacteroides distasonis]|jgi:ABC-2 type transport system permease protein|uniref:ABC transporter permease n=1 Tax=Parabacteroides TaxID=375288 RepID=UPI000961E9B4|nr:MULTISPECIES: ABC transporter permease [Parabacteroides]MBV4227924.1 ABC transporter permease [Parabacteroides distasonis]OKY97502.1 MAG: ABC transporter permease [Bacteroidales bacterium 43_36]RKU62181.1 ABC transporter permease [Parabacteroides sp. AF19-14]